jgi:hypothetical protein
MTLLASLVVLAAADGGSRSNVRLGDLVSHDVDDRGLDVAMLA